MISFRFFNDLTQIMIIYLSLCFSSLGITYFKKYHSITASFIHKTRKTVWKQTKQYCFNSFNPYFLEPRPPNLHKICKWTQAKLIRNYFLGRRYSDSFICQKCLEKKCAIPGCSISRKDKGTSIFKVPPANYEFNKKWSQVLIHIILKYRQRDKSLNERIESHKLFTCEKHFTADKIYVYPSRKSLKGGLLPTLNFPWPKANATNNRSTRAIGKGEEYLFLQA